MLVVRPIKNATGAVVIPEGTRCALHENQIGVPHGMVRISYHRGFLSNLSHFVYQDDVQWVH